MISKIGVLNLNKTSKFNQKQTAQTFTGNKLGLAVEFIPPAKDMFTPFEKTATAVLEDFKGRVGVKGQFLNWVYLPKQQLKRVDYFYDVAGQFKNATGAKKLTVVGIGGSKHPVQHALEMLNPIGRKDVHYYSDIDDLSFAHFKEEIGGAFKNSNYEVISKSGKTFDTTDPYIKINRELVREYRAEGHSLHDARKLANKHFVAVTDASESSNLRKIANKNKFIGQLFIHDDVGGRYSLFDDHVLFALATAGMGKSDMTKMLKSADKMTKRTLNGDISENLALQRAMFYGKAVNEGVNDFVHKLFGRHYEGGGTTSFKKQHHGESIKDTRLSVEKSLDDNHFNAEAHFDKRNTFNTTFTVFNLFKKKINNYKNMLEIMVREYKGKSDVCIEKLDVNKRGVTPEAFGAYGQMQNFEIPLKGGIRRALKNEPQPKVYDEVLQPSVEDYKKRAFDGKIQLFPGK